MGVMTHPFFFTLSAQTITLIVKKKGMEKITKITFYLWAVFAVLSFVSGWFAPLFWGIVNWVFGGMNILTLLTLLNTKIQVNKENKLQKTKEE